MLNTAPRKECTLLQCVSSLRDAGWEPVIFAEPGSTETDCVTIWNDERKGVWHNWLQACQYAIGTEPDVIMTVQDDSLFHPESKEFVEQCLWPDPRTGYLSLYTPKHYQFYGNGSPRPNGVYEIRTGSVWGAMGMVYHPKVLMDIITHNRALTWLGAKCKTATYWESVKAKRIANPALIQNSDTAIGVIVSKLGRKKMYINPSLIDHISKYSSIGHGDNTGKRNAYFIADPSLPITTPLPQRYELDLS